MTKEERLPIYKRALEIVDSGELIYGLDGKCDGLCLLLPCIWLSCISYMDDWFDDEGKEFCLFDTPKYFPEFGQYFPPTCPQTNRRQWRIDTLKSIIENY